MTDRWLYLDADGKGFLAIFHPPVAPPRLTSVLLIPPFGWEEVSSHRARRDWARSLAERGYAALRLDLPGTGDSTGASEDAETWRTWNGAVAAASAWLRAEAQSPVVTAIGIGLGGLLAYEAAVRGDVEDVVLWATPARGRSLVREMAAFSALETARIVEAGAPKPPPLPKGLLAPGGFVLSPETIAALESVDLATRPLPQSARVLMLSRDGIRTDPALGAAIADAGAELTHSHGKGYAAMLADPDQARPPVDVFESVWAWLEEKTVLGKSPMVMTLRVTEAAELKSNGVREQPLLIPRPQGQLAGILSESVGPESAPLAAVFLNAGAIRRIGPHRMWVETARRWALRGVTSLRLDLEGIGDADGDGQCFADVARFYESRFAEQVSAALDALEAAGVGNRFIVLGLCSGGFWAFHAALNDNRVVSALMLNPRVLYWDEKIEIERDLRRTGLLVKGVTWKRILRGEVAAGRWTALLRWFGGAGLRRLGLGKQGAKTTRPEVRIAEAFDRFRGRGLRARFIFCGGEPLHDELTRYGLLDQPERWPNVTVTRVPGRDHTLRPLWMHEYVVAALDEALTDELALAQSALAPQPDWVSVGRS